MAIVTHNIITQGLSGKLGGMLVFRQQAGKTIVSIKPDRSKVQLSGKQKQQNSRFREAVVFARNILKDEKRKAAYAARAKKGQSAYHVAIADYMRQPEDEKTVTGIPHHQTLTEPNKHEDLRKQDSNVLSAKDAPHSATVQENTTPSVIEKVPLSQHTSSTAKQRQQCAKTTDTAYSAEAAKVQKPYPPLPEATARTPMSATTGANDWLTHHEISNTQPQSTKRAYMRRILPEKEACISISTNDPVLVESP